MNKVLNFLAVFSCICNTAALAMDNSDFPWGPTVIYGDDGRQDLYQTTNSMHLDLADSTVALIDSTDVVDQGNGSSKLQGFNYGEKLNLCSSEPFRDQQILAFCSGFLVSEDIIVTAGHCIRDDNACAATKFVFGFSIKHQGEAYTTIPNTEVYNCTSVIHTEVNNHGSDFAVVRLDRKVLNHRPLELRREGSLQVGDPVLVIGHPAGLPTKIDPGANVRKLDNGFFVANLDTYGGNSGSAVFNDKDGKVEGILVRGENDFVRDPISGCSISNRCSVDGCRGEDVTTISSVLPFIN